MVLDMDRKADTDPRVDIIMVGTRRGMDHKDSTWMIDEEEAADSWKLC